MRWSKSKSTSIRCFSGVPLLVRLNMRKQTRNNANSAIPRIPMNFVFPICSANVLAAIQMMTSISRTKFIFKRRL
jgi:hypothetical protein